MPTKAYLVAAGLAHSINTLANERGIEVGPATTNLAKVKAWKDSLKKPQQKWVEGLHAAGFDTYEGTASFVDPHTVRVGEAELNADRILIATGSRTAVPPIGDRKDRLGGSRQRARDRRTARRLLVCGAGPVGLEFGQAFSRFGSKVTIVDAVDEIAPHTDHHAAMELREALTDEEIPIILGSFVPKLAAREESNVATITPREGGMEQEIEFDCFLVASGRRPNIEELNLEVAGVETYKLGIVVDERLRTNVPGIWAAGDVSGQALFTPVAQYERGSPSRT